PMLKAAIAAMAKPQSAPSGKSVRATNAMFPGRSSPASPITPHNVSSARSQDRGEANAYVTEQRALLDEVRSKLRARGPECRVHIQRSLRRCALYCNVAHIRLSLTVRRSWPWKNAPHGSRFSSIRARRLSSNDCARKKMQRPLKSYDGSCDAISKSARASPGSPRNRSPARAANAEEAPTSQQLRQPPTPEPDVAAGEFDFLGLARPEVQIGFPHETHAAEDLVRSQTGAHEALAARASCDRRLLLDGVSPELEFGDRLIRRETCGFDLGPDVGQHVLNRLETADGLAELMALAGMRDRHLQHALRAADRSRRLQRCGAPDRGLQGRCSIDGLAEHLPAFDRDSLEPHFIEMRVGQRAQANEFDAGGPRRNQRQTHPAAGGLTRSNQQQIGVGGPFDEKLAAAHAKSRSFSFQPRLDALGVGIRGRLEQRQAHQQLAARECGQPALLLDVAAKILDEPAAIHHTIDERR